MLSLQWFGVLVDLQHYKHVVMYVEKFIAKVSPSQKLVLPILAFSVSLFFFFLFIV